MISGEHFTDAELSCRHCGVNRCQPELIEALERYRAIVGRPVIVNDAYRCPVHNAAVGGAPNSAHMRGLGADVRVPGLTVHEMYRAALKVPAFATGGIGVAEHQGYVHLDVRRVLGRWCYNAEGRECGWDHSLDSIPV